MLVRGATISTWRSCGDTYAVGLRRRVLRVCAVLFGCNHMFNYMATMRFNLNLCHIGVWLAVRVVFVVCVTEK